MQRRIRLQKLLILGLAIVISILLMSLLIGRNDTVPVLVIGSDQIDITKPLSEQAELLRTEKMSRDEYDLFNGTIATSISDIKGAKLKFALQAGSPVLMSALTKTDTAGTFAASTPVYHTIFKMAEVISTLPPGIQAGDLVDVNLLIQKEDKGFVIGRLLQNVQIAGVEAETATLYLSVSQKEYDMLAISRQIGSFVVQLPGQKQVGTCQDVKAKLTKDKENEIIELTTKNESYKNLSEDDQAKMLKELDELHTFRLNTAECIEADDESTTITSDYIKELIESGKLDGSDLNIDLDDVLNEVDNNEKNEEKNDGKNNENKKDEEKIGNDDNKTEDLDFYN